jgi:hypothetical protein
MNRIEVMEKFNDVTDEDYDAAERRAMPVQDNWRYRRTNPEVSDIQRVAEIPDEDDHCVLFFWSGYSMIVKENYDDMCIALNDAENANVEPGDE